MNEFLSASAPMLLIIGVMLLVGPNLAPEQPVFRFIGAAVTGALMVRYLIWRGLYTLPAWDQGANAVLAYTYYVIEVLSSCAGLLMFHVLSRTKDRSAEVDLNINADFLASRPLIDMLIPTYNESREILERTIIGAKQQDYARFRVWVLDDSRREWLREMADVMGVGYLTRADNFHGKAGNMNAAIEKLKLLPETATFFAVLDADFIATPRFLSRAVTLFHDPMVAVVQTPQRFFNPDPIQLNLGGASLIPDEQRFFFDVILSSKDAHGTAFSCGTSALVRAKALGEIGGFPTESVTEDLLLSIKMKSIGYITAYLNEPLSVGLAPEGLGEYISQRARWCLGTMQIVRTPWGPFSKGSVPWLMRLHTLDTVLFWTVSPLMRIFGLLGPIAYWWTGMIVMSTDLPSIIYYLGPYWVSCILYLGWVSRGTNVPILADAMSLLMVVDSLRASVVGLFGSRNQKFKVTAKGMSRDRVVFHWVLMRRFLVLISLTAGGVFFRLWSGPISNTPPRSRNDESILEFL